MEMGIGLIMNTNLILMNAFLLAMTNTAYISINNAFLIASIIVKIILLWMIFKEVKKNKEA